MTASSITFPNTPLLRPDGDREPAVSIGPDGTVVYTALSWREYFTNTWKAPFGSDPVYQGPIDAQIGPYVGGLDADVDVGATGTVHFSTLMGTINDGVLSKLGVSAISCPHGDLAPPDWRAVQTSPCLDVTCLGLSSKSIVVSIIPGDNRTCRLSS